MRAVLVLVIALSLVTAGEALAGGGHCPNVTQATTDAGEVFVDEDGMTLYIYLPDGRYRPRCFGDCAMAWPPLGVGALARCPENDWTIIRRFDGRSQWALDGQPLYRSALDTKPGDISRSATAWTVAKVPCRGAKSRFGIPGEEEAFAVIGTAIVEGAEPLGRLRRWCGLELADLAARANLSAAELEAHESGARALGKSARQAVARALGIPVYLLLE